MYQVKAPENKAEFQRYYQFRWQMLRAPWHQAQGSEKDDLESQSIHRMILDEAGCVIAVGRLHKTSQTCGQIRYMAVAESHQGQGLGKRIIEALEQAAIKYGVREIQLNAREIARHFYLALGYQQIEKSHLLYGEIQHYSMVKHLNVLVDHQVSVSQSLVNTWHETIPMSKAMNMQIGFFDGNACYTHCDVAFNKNLHNTMFAGSIYTLATLTGWGWVYFLLSKMKIAGDIVLADAQIKYLSPVEGAGVGFTSAELVTGDLSALSRQGKARMSIDVEVRSGDKVAAKFTGKYVIVAKGPASE